MKKIAISLALILSLVWSAYIISHSSPFSFRDLATIGNPYSFSGQRNWFSSIVDCCSDGRYVYILYRNDIIDCYESNANYVCSMVFMRKRNGLSQMHQTRIGCIYEDGCDHHFYLIHDANIAEFIPFNSERHAVLRQMINSTSFDQDVSTSSAGTTALRIGANIYLRDKDGQLLPVTQRPRWMVLLQDSILKIPITVLTILEIFLVGFLVSKHRGDLP